MFFTRVDGSGPVDFSYKKCFKNNGAPAIQGFMPSEVHGAMRVAIQDQVDLFKWIKSKEAKECGEAPLCPLRGIVMT